MNVAIRVDCSNVVGMGHLMRCLAIAEKLVENGHDVLFIGEQIPRAFIDRIQDLGCMVESFSLPKIQDTQSIVNHASWLRGGILEDANATKCALSNHFTKTDWLIVDHYGIDASWESILKQFVQSIAVIDDLADRKHDCNLLLDQNIYEGWSHQYEGLVPVNCELLVGSPYILIRNEFNALPVNEVSNRERDLVIFMGGGDEHNFTVDLLRLLSELHFSQTLKVDVIIGPINANQEEVERWIKTFPEGRLFINPSNMATLYSNVKVAIGAPGGSTWERCCTGLPSIIVVVAENQIKVGDFLNAKGISLLAMTASDAINKYCDIKDNSTVLQNFANQAQKYVDGQGVKRFVSYLEKVNNHV